MILAGLLLLFVVYGVQKYLRRRLVKPDYTGQTIWITGASSGIG